MTKIYITKYSIAKGILEANAERINSSGFATCKTASFDPKAISQASTSLFSDKEYSLSKEDAILVVNEKRLKKIKSLRKQLKELEDLTNVAKIIPAIEI